jgi:K+-transporting ATPase ATPase C chain
MLSELKRGVLFTVVTMLLFGGVYPVVVWGVGQVVFPRQAQGSLIRRANGVVVGSSLLAQQFRRPEYLHPRPSAVDYNAASTGGSNYGPTNPDQLKLVRERVDGIASEEQVAPSSIPSEMVTTSGGGLDPHVPPNAAELQIARIARARKASPDEIRALVKSYTEMPLWGLFGRARVNVLELNLALDERFGPAAR